MATCCYPYPNDPVAAMECVKHVIGALTGGTTFTPADWHAHLWTIQGYAANTVLGPGKVMSAPPFALATAPQESLAEAMRNSFDSAAGNPEAVPWVLILQIAFELLRRFVH